MKKKAKQPEMKQDIKNFQELIAIMEKSDDFKQVDFGNVSAIKLYYYQSLINTDKLHTNLLPYCQQLTIHAIEELENVLPFDDTEITADLAVIEEKILAGFIAVHLQNDTTNILLIPAKFETDRDVAPPEIEFSVIGPKVAFIEDLQTNINLIRKRVKLPQLHVKKLKVGENHQNNDRHYVY
ncbi:spore germination protein [Gracilibacillus boraciitolerans JCM 21714]|uniref:Spore germination protein n=1 Tax=Gracilibacillus boraciitolerans JCM 21714 TaxID=1298598 RepID=W4VHZ0_9BACI|nr:spore germination protein [Gracilibacillus boraciitolerans JCM 21714]